MILEKVPIEDRRIVRVVGKFIEMNKPCLREWVVIRRIKQLATMGLLEIENRCNDRYMFNNITKIVKINYKKLSKY